METEAEWIKRKSKGYALEIIGILIVLFFGLGAMAGGIANGNIGGGVGAGLAFMIIGGIIAWYGGQLVAKAKQIAWTKQALREYDATGSRAARNMLDSELVDRGTLQMFCNNCRIWTMGPYCHKCGRALI